VRDAAVIFHLTHEIGGGIEHLLLANPGDEGDIDAMPVEVAGKIEQEDFEQHGAGSVGRRRRLRRISN
jgi:hypothetical protein